MNTQQQIILALSELKTKVSNPAFVRRCDKFVRALNILTEENTHDEYITLKGEEIDREARSLLNAHPDLVLRQIVYPSVSLLGSKSNPIVIYIEPPYVEYAANLVPPVSTVQNIGNAIIHFAFIGFSEYPAFTTGHLITVDGKVHYSREKRFVTVTKLNGEFTTVQGDLSDKDLDGVVTLRLVVKTCFDFLYKKEAAYA